MKSLSYRNMIREDPSDFKVHTSVYSDKEVFEDEMREIFERTWVYVGHETEVSHPGDYKTAAIGRQPVIITRSEDNRINVLLNACRHRGNMVCREELGSSNFFRCAYHGWVYKSSGELIGLPQAHRYDDGFLSRIGGLIKVPRVSIYRGFIFANLTSEGETLEDYLGALKKHIDLWIDMSPESQIRIVKPHKYSYPANWKLQAENGIDGYHTRYAHESILKTFEHFTVEHYGTTQVSGGPAAREVGCTRGFDYGHGTLERPGLRVQVKPELFQKYKDMLVERHGKEGTEQILNVRHIFIFPNLYLMDTNIRVIQPVSVNETYVYSHFFELQGVPEEINTERFLSLQKRLGTAGFFSSDDMEMFVGIQSGVQAAAMGWIVFSRGLNRETILADGERIGDPSDETPQRAIYRGWLRLMNGSNGEQP